eukprot:m.242397 g.242397  ORF g.242397 m.242397 type:complete len:445 (+) comp14031_c0_seq1:32-1366(+)
MEASKQNARRYEQTGHATRQGSTTDRHTQLIEQVGSRRIRRLEVLAQHVEVLAVAQHALGQEAEQLVCVLPQQPLPLLLDECAPRSLVLARALDLLLLLLLLELEALATLVQQRLDGPLVLLQPQPPLLRIHLLDLVVDRKLLHHRAAEFLLLLALPLALPCAQRKVLLLVALHRQPLPHARLQLRPLALPRPLVHLFLLQLDPHALQVLACLALALDLLGDQALQRRPLLLAGHTLCPHILLARRLRLRVLHDPLVLARHLLRLDLAPALLLGLECLHLAARLDLAGRIVVARARILVVDLANNLVDHHLLLEELLVGRTLGSLLVAQLLQQQCLVLLVGQDRLLLALDLSLLLALADLVQLAVNGQIRLQVLALCGLLLSALRVELLAEIGGFELGLELAQLHGVLTQLLAALVGGDLLVVEALELLRKPQLLLLLHAAGLV